MQFPQFKQGVAGVAVALAALSGGAAHAGVASMSFNVNGADSIGALGDAANEIRTLFIGAGVRITDLSWNVTLSTQGSSWLSEMGLDFSSADGSGVSLFPGVLDDNPGSASYSDSASLGSNSFNLGMDGVLTGRFFESFVDTVGQVEGQWRGSFTVTYIPEPASYALAALGLLGIAATRRRRV